MTSFSKKRNRNNKKAEMKEFKQSRAALLNILEDSEQARKEAEAEKNKTAAIITNFSDGLLFFDNNNKLSLINPQAETFFDVKSRDVVGRTMGELATFPTIMPVVQCLVEPTKEIFRQELSLKIPKQMTIEINTVSVVQDKQKTGTLVILHDITREKMVERMKTEFVSLSAHQLRTPLSAIKWTLRMLLDGDLGEITKEQREFIEKTYQSNERMISLINELLDITRIEEGRYLYKPIFTDFEPIIQFVVNSYREEIERKKINFEIQKPKEKLPRLVVDVEKMRLAIQNLLDNAIRYTPPGGQIIISFKKKEKEIEFLVKDTGIGIPKDQQARVFTKFFRGGNVIRMETEGSGLGLFIAKNIVEAHGGKIWFESKEGEGTTFYFSIPIRREFGDFLREF